MTELMSGPTSAPNLQDALTRLLLDGGTLEALTTELAANLGAGIAVTSTDGRVRAACLDDEQTTAMEMSGLIDATGRLRVERASGDGAPVGDTGLMITLPIVAAGVDLARLICVHPRVPDVEERTALRRAADLTALLMTREQAVNAVENKYRGDFLRDVFARRAGAEEYVVQHAGSFGWDLSRPMVVVAAEIEPPTEDELPVSSDQRRRWQERFAAAWWQVGREIATGVASVDFSSEVISLLPVADGSPVVELVERAVTRVAGDKGGGRRRFTVGVSRITDSVGGLPTAYAQARRALEVGRRVRGTSSVTHFDQLGLHRLLALIPNPAELDDYARDVLGELADDTAEAADLRTTLQILLDTNFNVAEAARLQFFHYNTMRYRLAKLERLLGPLAADPHLRLDIAVALRALEIS